MERVPTSRCSRRRFAPQLIDERRWTDKEIPLRLKEQDVVRITRLERSGRAFTGTEAVARAPRVGDEGTVVYSSGEDGDPFTVEMVDDDGLTVWVADFIQSELELLWAYPDAN